MGEWRKGGMEWRNGGRGMGMEEWRNRGIEE
jgi:hypothetical protein